MKRENRITFVATDEELDLIKKVAHAKGISVSVLIRMILMERLREGK